MANFEPIRGFLCVLCGKAFTAKVARRERFRFTQLRFTHRSSIVNSLLAEALLCPLAGIAMAFLCLGFIFGVFQTPEVALLPAVMIMTVYASRLRLPGRLPVGLVAMAVDA
ncbi:MAG TPA: hypothetical protein VNY29_11580, partial [Terriglobales bacterium]|nr:hypothetical protein [Terriglobales bacterium]